MLFLIDFDQEVAFFKHALTFLLALRGQPRCVHLQYRACARGRSWIHAAGCSTSWPNLEQPVAATFTATSNATILRHMLCDELRCYLFNG